MKKIPLSQKGKNVGKYFALVDDEDYEKLIKVNWGLKIHNANLIYAKRSTRIKNKSIDFFMHRIIMNATKSDIIDHIDGNGLNNQKFNLRFASNQQNGFNRRINLTNKSGFKGVRFNKDRNTWKAEIKKNGVKIYLGDYKNKIEAAEAYNKKALELFGEFARLNIIPGENAN